MKSAGQLIAKEDYVTISPNIYLRIGKPWTKIIRFTKPYIVNTVKYLRTLGHSTDISRVDLNVFM